MKNKGFDFKNPTVIFSLIAGIGLLGTAIVKSASYITLPDRVEAAEQDIESVQDYIKEQRISNELMKDMFKQQQQYQQQPQQPYCEWYESKFWCFDERTQQWYQPEVK